MGPLSIIPPLLVLLFAVLTRRVLLSLAIGLLSAAYIASDFTLLPSVKMVVQALLKTLNYTGFLNGDYAGGNTGLFLFIIAMGTVIILLIRSGATQAFTQTIHEYLTSRKDVEKSSLIISMLFFIDDYFSSLSVGTLMQPITDKFRVARAKLAFLIDSMACPITILCPFSSWVGVIIGFLTNSGIGSNLSDNPIILGSPFYLFLEIIPFIFYSFLIMGTSWYIVLRQIKFGAMGKHEKEAIKYGKLGGNKNSKRKNLLVSGSANVADFFVIWGILILTLVSTLLFHGNWRGFGGSQNLLQALQNTDVARALFSGSWVIIIICPLYLFLRQHIKGREIATLPIEGTTLMWSALIILLIAWSMGDILREDLQIGHYLAENILNQVTYKILPFAIFIAALAGAFATGSSWGTAALLFPMVIPPIAAQYGATGIPTPHDLPLFFPAIGALLSGCVAGDHISPISDTTIMTATSTDMPHLEHVRTQFTYAFPVILGTAGAFLLFPYLPITLPQYLRLTLTLITSATFIIVYIEIRHKFDSLRDQ